MEPAIASPTPPSNPAAEIPALPPLPTTSPPLTDALPTDAPIDLFMIMLATTFLFLTATILRLFPWTAPLPSRPRWANMSTTTSASTTATTTTTSYTENDALRHYIALPYGALHVAGVGVGVGVMGATSTGGSLMEAARTATTYEALLDIGEAIGPAKRGLTDEQIHVLPMYRCMADRKAAACETSDANADVTCLASTPSSPKQADEDDDNTTDEEQQETGDAWRGRSCAICRDDFRQPDTIRVLPCGDQYHAECIAPWLKQQATCPLCRSRFA